MYPKTNGEIQRQYCSGSECSVLALRYNISLIPIKYYKDIFKTEIR